MIVILIIIIIWIEWIEWIEISLMSIDGTTIFGSYWNGSHITMTLGSVQGISIYG